MKHSLIPLNLENQPLSLDAFGHWPKNHHVFSRRDIQAVNLAIMAQRPLLLRGEPGWGKSQLARAAAQVLERPLLSKVVNARCEPEDLMYRFDAVARIGLAQILPKEEASMARLTARNFLLPEILWWALNFEDAKGRYGEASKFCGDTACDYSRDLLHPFDGKKGAVVLIDEIDKADTEVPNSLLEVFSLGGFSLPYGGGQVKTPDGCEAPLVIVTTNEDRELPPAFIRRCFVHHMNPPKTGLEEFLKSRVRAHFPDEKEVSMDVLNSAVKQLLADRERLAKKHLPVPGLAELIDLIRGLEEHGFGADSSQVREYAGFAFQKSRDD